MPPIANAILGARWSPGRASDARRQVAARRHPVAPTPEYATPLQRPRKSANIDGTFSCERPAGLAKTRSTQRLPGEQAEQFAYIHSCARYRSVSPLDSAIVLSRTHPEDDSFRLYARDSFGGARADLVTISACYGAGSRAYSGEGLVGLSWAFLRAGCP